MIRIKFYFIPVLLALHFNVLSSQIIPADYKLNKSFTYEETISYYQKLDKKFRKATLIEKGSSDIGKPLHLFVMYGGKDFKKDVIDKRTTPVLLIMNGIHPGEPDGIDASLHLSEWILSEHDSLLNHLAVCIIPIYNIGGSLNRNCCSRANQNGPEAYGFRGNAKNLDLNRDFIKLDSKNAQSFVQLFQWLQPDYFVDTHVSNGADYQYTFTLLPTLRDKIWPTMGNYIYDKILPTAQNHMTNKGWPIAPYVNSISEIPDNGIVAFYDSPRYSSGYAALFNVPGFVVETHMLKPFSNRVESTLEFLKFSVQYMHENGGELHVLKQQCNNEIIQANEFGINWKLDTTRFDKFPFMGYEAGYKKSELTGMDRLYYDTQKPFTREISFYNSYSVVDKGTVPGYYMIPQGWSTVVEHLLWNGVPVEYLSRDTVLSVQTYKINSYKSSPNPYEGHHLKRETETTPITVSKKFYKGDIRIKTGTKYDYFLVSVLEPKAYDSYFTWGYFDSMLQEKEWFSDYVWEDKAWEIYSENETIRKEFDERKATDFNFAKNAWEQLYFIYQRSPNFEQSFMEYPVYKAF